MQRIMSTTKLKIYIKVNFYMNDILQNCDSALQLEEEIPKTKCMKGVCLVDINWNNIFNDLKKEVSH